MNSRIILEHVAAALWTSSTPDYLFPKFSYLTSDVTQDQETKIADFKMTYASVGVSITVFDNVPKGVHQRWAMTDRKRGLGRSASDSGH